MKNKNAGWQRVLLFIIPYFIVAGIFQFIGVLVSGVNIDDLASGELQETSFQKMIIMFFTLLGTFLIIWIFMKFVDKEKFIQLGFHIKNRVNDFIIGFTVGAVIMIIAYFLLLVLNEIQYSKTVFNGKELLISITTFVLVSVVEETLCRGYILKNLMLSFNKYAALILSSVLFSLMHAANPNVDLFSLFNLFLAGILLGLSYIYTKNLWFPIALHLSWNLFQTLLGFNVSGQNTYSIIEFEIHEANLINGGAFGFEGSFLSIIAMLIVITGIGIYYNRRKNNQIII